MSKFALNIAEDGRILSATFERFAPAAAALVDELPEGNISDYRYQDGKFVHDPLPATETEETAVPTTEDRLAALEQAISNIPNLVQNAIKTALGLNKKEE